MGGEKNSTTQQPNQAAAELNVTLQQGSLRARIDFSGNKNLRGYWAIYPDSKIEYTLIFSPKRPNDMLTVLKLGIDKNYLSKYHLYCSALDSKGISGESFSINKTPRVIAGWWKNALIRPLNGPLLGVYGLRKKMGISLIRNPKEAIDINWPPLRITDFGKIVSLDCYMNRYKMDKHNPELKRTYIRLFDNPSQMEKIVSGAIKKPKSFTSEEYVSFLKERITEAKKIISILPELKESGKKLHELENALVEMELSPDALLEIEKKLEEDIDGKVQSVNEDIQTIKSSIQRLKKENLIYQPVKIDIDKAEVYFRTADLFNGNERLSYQCEGFKLLVQAGEKLRVIKKSRMPDSLKGPRGKMGIAVTFSSTPLGIVGIDTLKALGIRYGGNTSFFQDKWVRMGEYDFSNLDSIFNYYDEHGLECMKGFYYQAYRLRSKFKEEFKDEIEVSPVGRKKQQNRFIMASPDMIPLKWTAMQKKLIQSFVRRYKDRKSVLTWDPWGETWLRPTYYHPLITKAYREFLKEKYQKIERLNKVWSQDLMDYNYAGFNEIIPPKAEEVRKHSWRIADWHLFNTKRLAGYIAWVTGIIKEIDPVHPIKLVETSGMYPIYGRQLDSYALAHAGANYKGAGIDTYPASNDKKHPWQEIADRIDSKRSANNDADVWVGETGHWNNINMPATEACVQPEEMREWVYTCFLHGAKFISFFRWNAGVTKWSLMEPDTTPTENAIAIGLVNCEANNLKPLWSAKPKREVALYYPRLSALHGKSNGGEMRGLHKILIELGFGVDPIDSEILKKRLNQYKLLVLPPSPYMYDDVEKEIMDFVKKGGVIICNSKTATGIYNRIGELEKSPDGLAKLLSQGMKLNDPVYSGNVDSISKLGKGNIVVIAKDIGKRYRDRKDIEQIRTGILKVLTENSIYPAASPDKGEIESAVLSNGKSKYLLIINHQHKEVSCKVTIYDSVAKNFGDSHKVIHDIYTLKPAMIRKEDSLWKLSTELEPMGVQIYAFTEK